ncbi:hypothetical protein [Sandaracinus amylolyticus]|uniref:Uncharacterized protein n=1 Tax=Sandaracinus amylolyticus TaxID=927083 RepID=A0A0F6W0T7_9BACT|nr:hypothetical protein [Sandaracinus amylolyticus]AKF04346.1 hypothetical protein DB32_001495 [Sandaracinus amylolyticus]
MRACSHALREACARTCASASSWRAAIVSMTWLAIVSVAHADPPVPRDGPFELRLAIENDNLLFGTYARMAGPELDGNDLGRTHASSIGMSYDIADRGVLELDLTSALFTRSISGLPPMHEATLPIHFHELSRLRLGGGIRRGLGPWRIRWGLAVEVSNREEVVAIGATGQQRWWHEFSRYDLDTGVWLYEYHPDGQGIRVGVAADASAGGWTSSTLAPWAWIEAEGDVGGRAGTLPGASWLEPSGRVALSLGDPAGVRLVLGLEQRAFVWIEQPGVMLRSTIDVRLDLSAVVVQLALHRYDGDQNVRYFAYALPNTTMTFALWLRL